jgi:HK97 family phage portal protein
MLEMESRALTWSQLFPDLDAPSTKYPVDVTNKTSTRYPPFFRGLSLISTTVAKLPLSVMRRVGNGKEADNGHPAHYLLKYKPNRFQTAYQWRLYMTLEALMSGNGYSLINRLNDGTPNELLPLDCEQVLVKYEDNLFYEIANQDGTKTRIEPFNMFHLRSVGDALSGWGLVDKGKENLSLGMSIDRWTMNYFKNNSVPNAVLEHPGPLSPDALNQLAKNWKDKYGGINKAGEIAILREGMKLVEFGGKPVDNAMEELGKMSLRQCSNLFGLPSSKLQDSQRTSFASLEQANQEFLDDAISPWLSAWESECWDKLLTEDEKRSESHQVESNVDALMRVNYSEKVSGLVNLVLNGIMTTNEARSKLCMNPLPNGDTVLKPLNMGTNLDGKTPTPAGN